MTQEEKIAALTDLLGEYRSLASWACVNRDDINRLDELEGKFDAFSAKAGGDHVQ